MTTTDRFLPANTSWDEFFRQASALPASAPGAAPDKGKVFERLAMGIRECREVFFRPCGIVCRVAGRSVQALLIVDGRRDLQTLLQRRLLEG